MPSPKAKAESTGAYRTFSRNMMRSEALLEYGASGIEKQQSIFSAVLEKFARFATYPSDPEADDFDDEIALTSIVKRDERTAGSMLSQRLRTWLSLTSGTPFSTLA
jgi:hypothetical protein